MPHSSLFGAASSSEGEVVLSRGLRVLFNFDFFAQKLTAVTEWEGRRRAEMEVRPTRSFCAPADGNCQKLLSQGIIPYVQQEAQLRAAGQDAERQRLLFERHLLMGQCAGAIQSVEPAAVIVDTMVAQAVATILAMRSKL